MKTFIFVLSFCSTLLAVCPTDFMMAGDVAKLNAILAASDYANKS